MNECAGMCDQHVSFDWMYTVQGYETSLSCCDWMYRDMRFCVEGYDVVHFARIGVQGYETNVLYYAWI